MGEERFKAIVNCLLIDGTGREALENATVLIREDKIVNVGKSSNIDIPPGTKIIDVSGRTVMPGLIDAHLHFMGLKKLIHPMFWLTEPAELSAIRSVVDAKKLLEAGFTSVRDASSWVGVYLKKAVDEGTIVGPRVLSAWKGISQTGGHGDVHNVPIEWVIQRGSMIADGVDECRKAARRALREGADLIKIFTTGGVLSERDRPEQPQFTIEEIKAITEEAHRVGKRVAAHAEGLEGIKNAIAGGVDTIEHAFLLDEETCRKIVERDLVLVPTLSVVHVTIEKGEKMDFPEYALDKAKEAMEIHVRSIRLAHRIGVKIATGTDFIGTETLPHGENALELELLTNEIGFTPMEAILSATKIAAEALGIDTLTGTLEKGKKADLIVVDGNPLERIGVLREKHRIKLVMKDGEILVERG